MSMKKVVLLVLCAVVAGTSAQCPPCDCFSVTPLNISLTELVKYSPLYLQAAATSSKGANLDSVCQSFINTCTPGNVLTQQTNTFIAANSTVRASIQTTNSTGRFSVIGPTRSYYDSIIGNPCPGTYTIYRCVITGTCVTDITKADAIVVSTRPVDKECCIEDGKDIGRKALPGLEFYDLPRKMTKNCQCTVSTC